MWLSQDDARSDFVLAVAAVVLGRYAVSVLAQIPGYPLTGVAGNSLRLVWVILLTGTAPYLLARYRNHVPSAFGLGGDATGSLLVGVVVAAPLIIVHILEHVFEGDFGTLLRSLLGRYAVGSPTVGDPGLDADRLFEYAIITVAAVGTWLFMSFLAVRARDAFRSPDMELTEAVRTFGIAGVGASLVFGVLNGLRGLPFGNVLLISVALFAMVMLVDQYVPPRVTTTRATILGPAIAVVVLYVLAAGGLFGGDLLLGLWTGSAAGVLMICVSALVEVKKGGAALVLAIAIAIYSFPVQGGEFLATPIPTSFYLF